MRCSCFVGHEPFRVKLRRVELEVVNEFEYLGSTVCSTGGRQVEVKQRIEEEASMMGGP